MTLDPRPSDAELLRRAAARLLEPSVIGNLVRKTDQKPSPETERKRKKIVRALNRKQADAIRTQFRLLCKAAGLPMPDTEYYFALPHRQWRFDYAWPAEHVALEVDGGLFSEGAHVRGAFILTTHEKLNFAAGLGWRVLYTIPDNLCTDPTITAVRVALEYALTGDS